MRARAHAVVAAGVIIASCGLYAARAAPASAHAILEQSDPDSGEQFESAPRRLRLTFSERPDEDLSSATVLDASGEQIATGPAVSDPSRSNTLTIALPELSDGIYTVTWRAVSTVDGHTSRASFAFGVGAPSDLEGLALLAPDLGGTTAWPAVMSIIAVALLDGALAVTLAGGLWGVWISRPDAAWLRRSVVVLVLAFALAGTALLATEQARAAGAHLAAYLRSVSGSRIALQAALLALAAVAVAVPRPRVRAGSVAALAAAAVVVHAYASHAGGSDARVASVALQAVHAGAASVWVGGLVWLLWRLRQSSTRTDEALVDEITRYSSIAGVALVLVLASGVARSFETVGSWSALRHSPYGNLVIAKLLLFAVLATLGAANRFRNVRRVVASRGTAKNSLRKLVAAEVVVAAAVFGVTGVLAGLTPSSALVAVASRGEGRAPTALRASATDYARTTEVAFEATPGVVGRNEYSLTVRDLTKIGDPPERVSVQFAAASNPGVEPVSVQLRRGNGQEWSAAGTELSLPGLWNVTVLIEGRDGGRDIRFELDVPNVDGAGSVSARSRP